jgi:hypothetical protein
MLAATCAAFREALKERLCDLRHVGGDRKLIQDWLDLLDIDNEIVVVYPLFVRSERASFA